MLHLKSAYVAANGTKLNYYRTGSGDQPLVLVHGITDDGLCWGSVAEALSGRFDIVMVDLRGHGKSEAPEGGYTLENLARELAGCIAELGLEKPVLLGHSLGGITSLVLAGLFPDLPRAILMEDAPPLWRHPSSISTIESQKALAGWIHAIKRKTKEELIEEAQTKNWTGADREFWVDAKQRVSIRVIDLISPPDIPTLDFPHLLSRIQCPALFIQTDLERGAASGAEDVAKLKALLPSLEAAYIPNASHSIRRTQFAPYLEAVERFLADLGIN